MCVGDKRIDDGTLYETQMAQKVNDLTRDLIRTLPNSKPKRVGDKLLDFLLCLIQIARKLGSRIFGWFTKVNQEQFCNVLLMWATIAQRQLVAQISRHGPMRLFEQDLHNFYTGVDLRNLSLVFHAVDYIVTFDDWGLTDLVGRLDYILSSSNTSQRILRYMNTASPHIHGGSWIALTQARAYLRFRTFGDYRRLMSPTSGKFDQVVRTHAEKALLDIYHTENAASYRVLLNSPERQEIVAKNLNISHARHYLSNLHSLKLEQLPRLKRQAVVRECHRFWAQDEVQKIKRWLDEGLPVIALARGLFHFSGLCMYPSARMINTFLTAASKTKSGLDGDAIIGYTWHSVGRSPSRKPVKVFEFFSLGGISTTHLHILGPVLSRENTNLVQQRFNDVTKYGYKHNLWRKYKSFLRYGFEVKVDQLNIKEHLRNVITKFITKVLPMEVKDRSLYLYAHLKKCYHLSELPLSIIFKYEGTHHLFECARATMGKKRQKALLQWQRWRERNERKKEVSQTIHVVPSEITHLGTPRKNYCQIHELNDKQVVAISD